MGDRSGQRLGNYNIIRLLGTGGFAEVYLAEHIYLKKPVAIKVLHTHLAQEEFAGFLQEAQTIARLKHPHIIPIFDFGIDSTPFLVMDYLPQGSLRQRHPRGTIVPFNTVVFYVSQIAVALQYAHDSQVIHRDVKPENILINANNEVVLSDFGIAARAHRTTSLKTMDISGSPSYMSPEHIAGKPRAASDQYSLGIVTYEWLCGIPPFSGEPMGIMYQHTYAPVPPLSSSQYIDDEVKKIVMRAIAKDPQDRFPSVQAFSEALKVNVLFTYIKRSSIASIVKALKDNTVSIADARQSAGEILALPQDKGEKAMLEALFTLGKKYEHIKLAYFEASKGSDEALKQEIELDQRRQNEQK